MQNVEITERPILMNAAMVKATLEGRKTMTRRIIKPQPEPHIELITNNLGKHFADDFENNLIYFDCPYGKPGDQFYVRESMYYSKEHDNFYYSADNKGVGQEVYEVLYAHYGNKKKTINSIHQLKIASRIRLEITRVRIERLKYISEEDSIAEGVEVFNEDGNLYYSGWMEGKDTWFDEPWKWHCDHPTQAFYDLWDSIYFERGFGVEIDPYVWVIEFKRI